MRLPIMRKQAAQMLSLPDLAGGLNMRDGISEVLDNQLTDCKNMWWSEGLLRTRPAMYENEKFKIYGEAITPIMPHNCYKIYGGTKVRLYSVDTKLMEVYVTDSFVPVAGEAGTAEVTKKFKEYDINFFWLGSGGLQKFSTITITDEADIPESYFVCQYSDTLYCFLSTGVIYKADVSNGSWTQVAEKDLYTPLVATYCSSNGKLTVKTSNALSGGTMIEGYNLLGIYYKVQYNAYNPDIDNEAETGHIMTYALPENCCKEKYKGKTVIVEYTAQGGKVYTHKVTLTGSTADIEESSPGDGMIIKVFGNMIYFLKENSTTVAYITSDNNLENNVVITAPYVTSAKEKQKVFGMTRTEWFGGGTSGLSGGTRLFLCGNEKHPNLVLWSGLNNPLYFPENCYFYVGNETGAVTGFGKQSDKLVIFKESETWCTEYAQNTNIDAESLISGSVVDYAASAVYFPLTQINPNIGCSYPDTVKLCRNRLVWLGSDNKVYTLVSESPYTERSIYCVSEMVDRKISETAKRYDISCASACDHGGYYCLLLKDRLLLMDYNCYGYTHVASYSKTEDANIKIPWFLWELPKGSIIADVGGTLTAAEFEYGVCSFYFADYSVDLLLNENGERYENPIVSSFTTKVFNFGAPHVRKNIEQINLQLGNNGGEPVTVFFVTENGTEQTDVRTGGSDTDNYTAGYIDSRAVFPCIKQVLRLGLKLECKGTLAVDSVILKYRTGGTAR